MEPALFGQGIRALLRALVVFRATGIDTALIVPATTCAALFPADTTTALVNVFGAGFTTGEAGPFRLRFVEGGWTADKNVIKQDNPHAPTGRQQYFGSRPPSTMQKII